MIASRHTASGILLLCISACLLACGGGGSSSSAAVNVQGKYTHNIIVDGERREFIVYVPALAVGVAKAPVVFMFHGTSGDGEKFYNISRWVQLADQFGIIAVFPSALLYGYFEEGQPKTNTKWAAGNLGDGFVLFTQEQIDALPPVKRALADHPLMDDVHFVEVMLDFLDSSYAVDQSRTYARGFSNGGAFTSRLIVDLSHRFAGIAAAAGPIYRPFVVAPTSHPMPVVFSVGDSDPRFADAIADPIPLDESLLDIPESKFLMVTPYLQVLDLADIYTFDTFTVGGETVARFTYSTSNGAGSNVFQLLVIEGLEHAYPNGANHDLILAAYLWNIFEPGSPP